MSSNQTNAMIIARRYATAIFGQALTAKKEGVVVQEINEIAVLAEQHPGLRDALANPLVSRDEKANTLAAIAASGDAITVHSVEAIARGGRASLLSFVAKILRDKLSEHRGERIAEVISARPLSDAVQKQLAEALARATGKKVNLELKQDASVLGGVIVQMGSLRLDASLAGALNQLRVRLESARETA